MKYVKDMEEGNKVKGIYYCKSKISTETKTGKPYDNIELQDKTGAVNGKVWNPTVPGEKNMKPEILLRSREKSSCLIMQNSCMYPGFVYARMMNTILRIICRSQRRT